MVLDRDFLVSIYIVSYPYTKVNPFKSTLLLTKVEKYDMLKHCT